MGVSKEKAAENRQAIVAAAACLFRERGVDGVGLVELMKEAGFTQGGFYNHFKSKQALVDEVIASAMSDAKADLPQGLDEPASASGTALMRQLAYYLSTQHRDDIEHGCPVAGFSGDVARLGADAQSLYAGGLEDMFGAIAAMMSAAPPPSDDLPPLTGRERAIGRYCEMLGALVLSRAVAQASPALSQEVLKSAHKDLLAS
jgi:TetR/AcrR family transcriptional repressor of nem operon